jgi:bacterial/archaeal transporter family protein
MRKLATNSNLDARINKTSSKNPWAATPCGSLKNRVVRIYGFAMPQAEPHVAVMSWIVLGALSALFLGVYDLFKKQAVTGNAVLPVLFLSSLVSAVIWLPGILLSSGESTRPLLPAMLQVETLTWREHAMLLLKAMIVSASWVSTYFAIKQLPLSIASPIRSTAPLWTLFGALLIYGEQPSVNQGLGIALTLISFLALSIVGQSEGIQFRKNLWVGLMVLGTVIGSASALYDKYLLSGTSLSPAATQAWFSVYLAVVLALPAWGWLKRWWPRAEFQWKWSIPLISLSLLFADFAYFTALKDPEALISVLSSLRRANVLITFFAGILLFREKQFRAKLPCVLGILLGAILILN